VTESPARRDRSSDLGRLLVLFVASTSLQAVRPTASYRTLELGGTAVAVGLVTASYAALSAIAAVPSGRIIDRFGPRPFLLGGLAVLAGGNALSAVAPTVLALAGAQALLGVGQISIILAIQTITANCANPDRGFARFTVAASLGGTLGPLVAGSLMGLGLHGALEGRGTALVFAASALLALLGLALATWGVAKGPAVSGKRATGVRAVSIVTIMRRSGMPQALTTSVVVATAVDLLTAYLPVVGEAHAIPPSTIGILLSLRAVSGLLSRLTMTTMLRRLGRQRLLLGAMLTSGIAMLGIALIDLVWLLGGLMVVVGFSLGLGAPITMAWVALLTPESERGTAMAVRLTGNRIGEVILPVLAGSLASTLSPSAVFVFVTGTLLGGAAWARGTPPET
jgi:MFS family permease